MEENDLKITVLFGSPHSDGVTRKILNKFLSVLDVKKRINFYDVYKINPLPCYDCGYCKDKLKCKNRDLDEFFNSLSDSDFLIIASPIYNSSFPSTLKSVLDRFQPLYYKMLKKSLRRENDIKKGSVIITVQGCDCTDYNENIISQWRKNLSLAGYEISEFLNVRGTDSTNLDIDKFYKKSKNVIYKLMSKYFKIGK